MAEDGPPSGVEALLAAARVLAVDAGTADVASHLNARGISSILLKGPALSSLLYDEPGERIYSDADLLVPPGRYADAEDVLRTLGFRQAPAPPPPPGDIAHAEPWVHPSNAASVDLHRTLFGVGVPPEEVWPVLSERLDRCTIAGTELATLDVPGRLLLVCLHAIQHDDGRRREDLRRALERGTPEQWRDVRRLAERLDAVHMLATGLRLAPEGQAVAESLRLVGAPPADAARNRGSRAPLAVGMERLADTPTARAKARLLLREVFPSPAYLRFWRPLARRGPVGLALAYVWRPLWLCWHAPASVSEWRRARRAQP